MSMDSSGVGELRIMSWKAFLVFMFTVLITVTVCTKPTQYFVERGADAKISCDFGNGQIRNLYWQYVSGSDLLNILTYFKGEITKGEGYSDRVELAKDKSTLIIRDIALADEGLYQCDVDRNNNTGVVDLYSELIVFVQPFESAPSILECIQTPSPTPCEHRVTAESASNLTCTLSGFYPQDIATLEWRHEGNVAKQTPAQPLENEDGTFDLTRTIFINISQSDVYVCIASFRSTEGVKTANASISVTDLGAYEMNDTPKNNVGLILGLIFGLVMIIIVSLIVAAVCRKKRRENERQERNRRTSPTTLAVQVEHTPEENEVLINRPEQLVDDENVSNTSPPNSAGGSHQANGAHPSTDTDTGPSNDSQMSTDDFEDKLTIIAKNITDDEKIEALGKALGLHPGEIATHIRTNQIGPNVDTRGTLKMLRDWKQKQHKGTERQALREALKKAELVYISDEFLPEDGAGGSHQAAGAQPPMDAGPSSDSHSGANEVTNQQITKLAKLLADNYYNPLGIALGFEHAECKKILTTAHMDHTNAFYELLQQWKTKTGGSQDVLDAALRKVNAGGLIPKYKCE